MSYPLPDGFLSLLTDAIGTENAEALCHALDHTSPCVSLRLNPGKPAPAVPTGRPVAWCATGLRLDTRPQFTLDPLLHAGAYYVQEASSMFVEQAYRAIGTSPGRMLDLCAAPGGKSTLWRTLLPDGALLVANEPDRQRREVLQENLAKWGHPDTVVTQAFPADFAALGGFFDLIAADVPCSGEGMFRKDPGAREQWSADAVVRCAGRQREIIRDVWPALREGGHLVYSTCTFNFEENERNIEWICRELGAEPVEIPLREDWHVTTLPAPPGSARTGYRFLPHLAEGEGFFLTLLRKTSEAPSWNAPKIRTAAAVSGCAEAAGWLEAAGRFRLMESGHEGITAVRHELRPAVEALRNKVRVTSAGIPLASRKGRKLIPSHELALSLALRKEAFPFAELPLDTALAYLRREAIRLPAEMPRGYCLVGYDGLPLGFVNNLGTRANNLYPQPWRIRHG